MQSGLEKLDKARACAKGSTEAGGVSFSHTKPFVCTCDCVRCVCRCQETDGLPADCDFKRGLATPGLVNEVFLFSFSSCLFFLEPGDM